MGALVLSIALAGCACPPSLTAVPKCLQPYTEMARFFPPGMRSYAFGVDEMFSDMHVLLARAGDNFRPPEGIGLGPYDGVEVLDFGPHGAEGFKLSIEPRRLAATLNGTEVWEGKPTAMGWPTCWSAYVDGRYCVRSYDLEAVKAALTKPGSLPEILGAFPPVSNIPEDADYVVCLLPRPEDKISRKKDEAWYRAIPIEVTVVAISTPSRRLVAWHQKGLPAEFTEAISDFCEKGSPTESVDGGWMRSESALAKGYPVRVLFEILFGTAIRN